MIAAATESNRLLQQIQREHNRALLQHVASCQPCRFEELYRSFGDQADLESGRNRFAKRLSYLVNTNRLKPVNVAGTRCWELAVATPVAQPVEPVGVMVREVAAPETDPAPPWVGTMVPARQVDVMHCPNYVPDRDLAARPGAFDYKRVASRGVRC